MTDHMKLTDEQKRMAMSAYEENGARWGLSEDGIFAAVEAVLATLPKPTGEVYQVTLKAARQFCELDMAIDLSGTHEALQAFCDRNRLVQQPADVAALQARIAELEAYFLPPVSPTRRDWRPTAEILASIMPNWRDLPEDRRELAYRCADAARTYYLKTEDVTCSHCGKVSNWRDQYKCWDCKAWCCETCVKGHFGPSHAPHPRTLREYEARIADLEAQLAEGRPQAMTLEVKAVVDAAYWQLTWTHQHLIDGDPRCRNIGIASLLRGRDKMNTVDQHLLDSLVSLRAAQNKESGA